MTLYYRFENKVDSSEKYALMLNKEFPNNPIFERWFARIIFKKGKLASADSIYKNILCKADNKYPGYNTFRNRREANYYLGYHLRNEGKYDSAMVYLNKSMDYSLKMHEDRESGFLINATLYLGMIKENKREYAAAKMYYEKVLDMREFGNSHGLAESYLERIEQREKKIRN
jgi:tetratricopeptide (TPR) repeat protein